MGHSARKLIHPLLALCVATHSYSYSLLFVSTDLPLIHESIGGTLRRFFFTIEPTGVTEGRAITVLGTARLYKQKKHYSDLLELQMLYSRPAPAVQPQGNSTEAVAANTLTEAGRPPKIRRYNSSPDICVWGSSFSSARRC